MLVPEDNRIRQLVAVTVVVDMSEVVVVVVAVAVAMVAVVAKYVVVRFL